MADSLDGKMAYYFGTLVHVQRATMTMDHQYLVRSLDGSIHGYAKAAQLVLVADEEQAAAQALWELSQDAQGFGR